MRPGPRLIPLVALWAMLALAASFRADWESLWVAGGLVFLLTAVVDWIMVKRAPGVVAQRTLPHSLPLGVWSEVHIRLTNRGNVGVTVEVYDHHPPSMETEGIPRTVEVPSEGWVEISYRARPGERGEQTFARIDLLLHSGLKPADLSRQSIYRSSRNGQAPYDGRLRARRATGAIGAFRSISCSPADGGIRI